MKSNTIKALRIVPAILLGILLMASAAYAQPSATNDKSKSKSNSSAKKTDATPTSTTTGDDAGDYIITSTFEVGYRGLGVYGDERKYRSDLGYKAGPRLFDSSFLMRAKEGKGGLFDTLLVTATGWGADPTSSMRLSAEKPEWYKLEANYRRAKYYRYLNNIANPNWVFGTVGSANYFPVPPSSVTGLHGYNTRTEFGDFDLTLLPKNDWIRFNIGYSPEHYSGPFFTNYHQGGNEFQAMVDSSTRANDLRLGAEGTIGKVDWTFLHGIRWFKEDSAVATVPAYINPNNLTNSSAVARFTSFHREEPTRGRVDFTRLSAHTFLAQRFDITGRFIYSKATSNSIFLENETGVNFASRITGQPGSPNTLLLGAYNIPASVSRPNTQGDVGLTILATDKLRISNTFRVEDFTIDGFATFNDIFSVRTPAGVVDTRTNTFLQEFKTTKYRKYQNTIEGDYQFNNNYSIHFGYRYGNRKEEETISGYHLNSNAPTLQTPGFEAEENHTHSILGGFRMRPIKNWTVYFDGEHGTADNVFTRIGNYDYTNLRAKTRWIANRKVNLNLGFILRDNTNPSEIAGETLGDFGVDLKTRIFQSSIDWLVKDNLSFNFGYNYNWVNSDATIDYVYQVIPAAPPVPAAVFHHFGHALYFQRNHFFNADVVWRPNWRVSFYGSYRVNLDDGQGDRLSDPTGGTPIPGGIVVNGSLKNPANEGGTLITSYPMSFQSPEFRFAIRLNRHLDWNLGYQYFNYNEDGFLRTFPLNAPRAQNYHAHLPYMSLRIYIGRKE
jgi:hypothetical protein